MKKIFFIVAILISTLANAQVDKWNQKDDYFYNPELACVDGEGKVCISKSLAEAACKKASNITTAALRSKEFSLSNKEKEFINGANLVFKGTIWTLGRCMVGVEWRGVMNGTSHRERKVYGVTAFGRVKNEIFIISLESGLSYEQGYGQYFD